MPTYPDEAYQPVMNFYGKLPPDKKDAANKILGAFANRYEQGEAPPEEMLSSLQALVSKKEGGLEAATNAAHSEMNIKAHKPAATRTQYALGLAAVLTFVALASVGMPYAPPPLY